MNRSNTKQQPFMVQPVGIIHSAFHRQAGTPIQSVLAETAEGTATIFPEFTPALQDLEGFDRVWLLCWLDRAAPADLLVTPYLDTRPRGVFATRSPSRPNPIGLSCVRLLEVRKQEIRFAGVDLLDGTPLLDIKPYMPDFDVRTVKRCGWYDQVPTRHAVADDRFAVGSSSTRPSPFPPESRSSAVGP